MHAWAAKVLGFPFSLTGFPPPRLGACRGAQDATGLLLELPSWKPHYASTAVASAQSFWDYSSQLDRHVPLAPGLAAYRASGRCFSVAAGRISFSHGLQGGLNWDGGWGGHMRRAFVVLCKVCMEGAIRVLWVGNWAGAPGGRSSPLPRDPSPPASAHHPHPPSTHPPPSQARALRWTLPAPARWPRCMCCSGTWSGASRQRPS